MASPDNEKEKIAPPAVDKYGLPITERDASRTIRHQEVTKVKVTGSFQPDVPTVVGEGLFSGQSK